MKKYIAILLCITLGMMSLTACGSEKEEETAVKTESEDKDEAKVDAEVETIETGKDMENATELSLNTKVAFEVKKRTGAWVAFTTSDNKEDTYNIIAENTTADSEALYLRLFDKSGDEIVSFGVDNSAGAVTESVDGLKTDTTYYLILSSGPNTEKTEGTIIIENPAE